MMKEIDGIPMELRADYAPDLSDEKFLLRVLSSNQQAVDEVLAAGLEDTAKRGEWNRGALPEYALPTEAWRELIVRRRRYDELRSELAAGEVQSVNDSLALNLDSERFARGRGGEGSTPNERLAINNITVEES